KLIKNLSLSDSIFLLIRGELPNKKESLMFNSMLVACMDHGITPPSTLAARVAASGGGSVQAAIAAGLLAIGDHHGGAIEPAMNILVEMHKRSKSGESLEDIAKDIYRKHRALGKRIPGLGHRFHTVDPRGKVLLSISKDLGLAGIFVKCEKVLQKVISKELGRKLPINVDGGIAPIALELGFDPRIGNAFFVLGRIGGIIAHVYEEKTKNRPMRKMWDMSHIYTGPEERELDE
ncbi:MAG: citryl-CoA lyase, partial [Candidatus Ranarchaeia archaeon]